MSGRNFILYKILTILSITILTPLYAYGLCDIQNDSCISFNGCYLEQTLNCLRCNLCPAGYYNSNSLGITKTCTQCPTSYSVSEAGKIPNPDAYDDGQSECPWMCDANYYKSGDSCEICPTGATSPAGSTAPTQCQCEQNKYLTQNNGEYIWQSCPTHSFTNASGSTSITDCQCEAQYYMGGINNNQCVSCPEHGNCAYAGRTYLTATCASRYQKCHTPRNIGPRSQCIFFRLPQLSLARNCIHRHKTNIVTR